MFRLADQLRHGTHRAIDAPASGLEQEHGADAQYGGGQHYAVKAKGKLGHARVEAVTVVGPVPGQLQAPEKGYHLRKLSRSRKHQRRDRRRGQELL